MTHEDTSSRTRPEHYSDGNILLHWVSALLVFGAMIVAWVMTALPPQAASRLDLYRLHKSIGLTVVVLTIARLLLRYRYASPAQAETSPVLRWASTATHAALYAMLLLMPISGYVSSSASGYPVRIWGLPLPSIGKNEAVAQWGMALHFAIQWWFYAVIVLHLAAVVWHVWFKRDGLLQRMLPKQRRLTIGAAE